MGSNKVPATENDLLLKIEALLFAAGKPLTVHELAGSLGTPDWNAVQHLLKKLQHNYGSRQTALEIRRAGDGWAIQLKKDLTPVAHKVAAAEIPRRTLKTLALIAYHKPIRQSRLARMIGDYVYEDIPRLRELGFIRAAERANTLELTTTSKFAEYFGFETADKAKLKVLMEQGLGIERPAAPADAAPAEEGEPPADPPAESQAAEPSPPRPKEGLPRAGPGA